MFKKIYEKNYFLKPGYASRNFPQITVPEMNFMPDIYLFAAHLGNRYECKYIIDVGCGNGANIAGFYPQFTIIGVDSRVNVELCRYLYPFGNWIEEDLDNPGNVDFPKEILSDSIIICTNVFERLTNPCYLLSIIRRWMDYAPVCLMATVERDLARGINDPGPPDDPSHVREWNRREFKNLLLSFDLNITNTGLTITDIIKNRKESMLSIVEKNRKITTSPPESFKVAAIIKAYNEEDIIYHSIKRLIDQEIYVYVTDNWSTDATYSIIKRFEGNNYFLGSERYPPEGRSNYFHLKGLLKRTEELAKEIDADWFIHHDVDEIRESPWPGTNLKEGIYRADCMGFNAIDHTVITFYPVDDNFTPCSDFGTYFKYFEFSKHPGDFVRINAWKNTGKPFLLSFSGGHEIAFAGRRVFPYKFLMKHYPIRSQAHGEKKIFADRKPRWHPEERAIGWHNHYDNIQPGSSLLRKRNELSYYNEDRFYREFLVERLSGIGIGRLP